MTPSNSGDDLKALHVLASAAMDGSATEAQLRELTDRLRESDAARDEYLALVDLHAVLSSELMTAGSAAPMASAEDEEATESVSRPSRSWHGPAAAMAALAATLMIALAWFRSDDPVVQVDSFASLAQVTNAKWASGSIEVGDRLGPSTMNLQSGLVRIEFDSGVEVTLEGPAEYKLVDVATTELTSGLLTATVPPGAEGFMVDTPSAQVIDLGTSFGIDLRNDQFSNVSVFDGEVEITSRDKAEKRLLSEGESVRIGTNYAVKDVRFDPKPFEKLWPIASGIVSSTEAIDFVPPWPRQIRFVQSDDTVFVRAEGHARRLNRALNVNISQPGEVVRPSDLSPGVIRKNTPVRSYILHYSPQTPLGPRKANRVTGSITFDRPVLGLIVNHDELMASSRRFGRRGAGEGNHRRDLSLTDDDVGDRISLSEDRKTVTLQWISPNRSSDLVRVIVEKRGGFRHMTRRKRN